MTANRRTVLFLSLEVRGERMRRLGSIIQLFRQFIPINSDLLMCHLGYEFMGMLNLEAGGFLQIRLP